MSDRFVVLATGMGPFLNNAILDPERVAHIPEGPPIARIANEAIARGFRFATWDRVDPAESDSFLILRDLSTPARLPRELLRKAAQAACYCLESPLVVHDVYHRIDKIADDFSHTFMYPGVRNLLTTSRTEFHPQMWPNTRRNVINGPPWAERDLLVLISRNKRVHAWDSKRFQLGHPRQSVRVALSNLRAARYRRTDPWMRSELYVHRLEAINHFGPSGDLALFGMGWDEPVPVTRGKYASAIAACYRGLLSAGDKISTLTDYRFTLCFENAIFPGYITEKIFDAMFSGSIPVYLGAPDVLDYIPQGAFVDVRSFSAWGDLEGYLKGLSEREASVYLEAAGEFVHSDAFERFTAASFARRMIDALASEI